MATLLRTDATVGTVSAEGPEGMFTVEQMNAIFPSGLIDVIQFDKGQFMVVDDNGFAAGLPVNPYATLIYRHRLGGTTPIVGPALLCDATEVGYEE